MGGLGVINTVAKPLDYVAWGIFAAVVVGYHSFVFWRMRHRTDTVSKVNLSLMVLVNPAYIGKFVRKAGSELTPVQTLRNSSIAATFVGGFAFTTASTYISELVTSSAGNPEAEDTLTNRDVRRLVIASLLYLSFINFAVAVRFATHIGYLVGVATGMLDSEAPAPLLRRTYSTMVSPAAEAGADAPSIGAEGVGLRTRSGMPTTPATAAAADPTDAEGEAASDPRGLRKGYCRYFLSVVTCGMYGRRPVRQQPETRHAPADLEAPEAVEAPLSRIEAIDVAIRAQEMIKRLSVHFSLGFRAFYAAIPVALYGAGSIPFIVSSLLLLLWFHYIDFGLAA